jgi:hypothetical protein
MRENTALVVDEWLRLDRDQCQEHLRQFVVIDTGYAGDVTKNNNCFCLNNFIRQFFVNFI